MDKRTARSRWLNADGRRHMEAILKALQKGHTSESHLLENAGQTEQGLIDLRGISFGLGIELEEEQFRDIDFSYSDFGRGIFRRCLFERTLFREINSHHWNERGCQFVDVDFYKASLQDASIGIDGSTYIRVSFLKANFAGASFIRPQFKECDFSDARLKGIDFFLSNFIDCKFRGRLESVWFRRHYRLPSDERNFGKATPNEMRHVDFSEAELWDVTFTGGLDLSQVVLPHDGFHLLFRNFGAALLKARQAINALAWSDEEKKEAKIMIESFLVHAQNQPMWILNAKEILAELGDKLGKELVVMLSRFDMGDD
jgi:fluoroquinolone resistance protein